MPPRAEPPLEFAAARRAARALDAAPAGAAPAPAKACGCKGGCKPRSKCGCRALGQAACHASCGCGPLRNCAWAADFAARAPAPAPDTPQRDLPHPPPRARTPPPEPQPQNAGEARRAKIRVYVAVPGEGRRPEAIRSQMLDLLRQPAASLRRHCQDTRPDRFVCGYTGRSLAWERRDVRPGLPQADVEHIIEGQMDGHVLAYCDDAELRKRLRLLDTGVTLPHGFVRSTVFAPHYRIHNSDLNLTFADHSLNMCKKGPVMAALTRLDAGRALERPLQALMTASLTGWLAPGGVPAEAALDEDAASKLAARICARMRDVEGPYCAALEAVGPDDAAIAGVQGSVQPLVAMYAAIAEEMGQLYGALGL